MQMGGRVVWVVWQCAHGWMMCQWIDEVCMTRPKRELDFVCVGRAGCSGLCEDGVMVVTAGI